MSRKLGVGLLIVFVVMWGISDETVFAKGAPDIPFRWSADSTRLLVDTYCTAGADEQPGIYLLEIEDGQINSGTLIANNDFYLSLLPPMPPFTDSVIVATEEDLYLIDLETFSFQNLTDDILPVNFYSWRWSPDNKTLFFSTTDDGQYAVNTASNETYTLASSIYYWLPDGTPLIRSDDGDLYTVNITTNETHLLTADVPPIEYGWEASPDGETLVIRTSDEDGDLYALDIATGETRNLTSNLHSVSRVWNWLPGSETLIIWTSDGNGDLFAVDIATGETRNLTLNLPPVEDQAWQLLPDDETLVARLSHDPEVHILNIATGEARNLTTGIPNIESMLGLSPDGRTLPVIAAGDLYAVDVSTGQVQNITMHVRANPYNLTWSPESDVLFLQQSADSGSEPGWHTVGPYSIYVIPSNTFFASNSLSPNRRLLAFEDCTAEFGVQLVNLDDAPND